MQLQTLKFQSVNEEHAERYRVLGQLTRIRHKILLPRLGEPCTDRGNGQSESLWLLGEKGFSLFAGFLVP